MGKYVEFGIDSWSCGSRDGSLDFVGGERLFAAAPMPSRDWTIRRTLTNDIYNAFSFTLCTTWNVLSNASQPKSISASHRPAHYSILTSQGSSLPQLRGIIIIKRRMKSANTVMTVSVMRRRRLVPANQAINICLLER